MNIRTWLRKSPNPVKLLIGKTIVQVPDSRTKWAEIEQTIVSTAEDGDRIACLDAAGAVLRSMTYDCENADETPAAKPGDSELVLLARELNVAADNGARRHEAAYAMAFDRITGLCQTISDRLSAMETMWSKAMLAQARAQADAIVAAARATEAQNGSGESDMMKMLGPMIGPMMAGMASPPAAPPNGSKKAE